MPTWGDAQIGRVADRYALIRRVALDVTGLPPSQDEIQTFIEDPSGDAYEKMVDRFLAKASYGEHWARMWLDMARYADSSGDADDPARTIWLYRDYVIGAFNRNLPFDQFTIEQLAGDLLPNASAEQLIATAFHRNTLTNNEGGTNDVRRIANLPRFQRKRCNWIPIIGCWRTNTPLQALVTLNDPVYIEAAQALGRKMFHAADNDPGRIEYGLKAALCRPIHPNEREVLQTLHDNALTIFKSQPESARKMATEPLGALPEGMDPTEMAAWTVFAWYHDRSIMRFQIVGRIR